jgi:hypothetical protein
MKLLLTGGAEIIGPTIDTTKIADELNWTLEGSL